MDKFSERIDKLNMSEHQQEYTLGGMEANLKSLAIIIPLVFIMVFSYQFLWGWEKTATDLSFLFSDYLLLFLSLVLGTIAHELLHGAVWLVASGLSWGDMHFGFNWKAIAPYAHCNKPMAVKAYRRGVLAPGLILGIFPFVLGMILGQSFLTGFGFIFTLVAGGDFLMLWVIRNVCKSKHVQDHPSLVGCIVTNNIEMQ
ncbi:MAG: DUF3267 domain-containing protein [Balneolaceae bacterium]|nr:DUF3267 domain-containing protein [Balneolaceae bacterium]